jgi:hypothetical protein
MTIDKKVMRIHIAIPQRSKLNSGITMRYAGVRLDI